MNLLGPTEDTIGFPEVRKSRPQRLFVQSGAGSVVIFGQILPRARENTFPKVVHNKWRIAFESSVCPLLMKSDCNLIPCSRFQRPYWHLVPKDGFFGACIVRGESPTRPDLDSIDPDFVSTRQIGQIHPDGFFEQVPFMLGEEAIVDLHPAS